MGLVALGETVHAHLPVVAAGETVHALGGYSDRSHQLGGREGSKPAVRNSSSRREEQSHGGSEEPLLEAGGLCLTGERGV